MQLPAYPSNTYHQLSRAPSTGGRMTCSPCIPACLATVVPFTLWPGVMAAWRDEKNHVTRADIVALTSCCSLPFQTQLTRREWRQGAAWATRVSTIIQNRSRVPFFTTTKSLFSLMTYLHVFLLKLLSHVLALMAVFIFHSNGAEYCSFTSVFINNSSTTFWINLLTRRIQMRKAKTPICCRTHFHLYCPTGSAQFTQ